MLRSHAAGRCLLRRRTAGHPAGWVSRRRDHGGVIFIDLRDSSGTAQVVFREVGVLEQAHRLRAEFCVPVEGVVEIRPEGNANPDIVTGDIEVNATSLTVLGRVPRRRSNSTSRPARKPGSSTDTSTCAAMAAPATRCVGCAEGQRCRAVCAVAGHDSSRSRRRRSPVPPRRAPGTSWFPPACSPAASMPRRRARSCSSSC